jgi:ABC-type branched-subunit amino acid transport system ATPase component/ABC-type branched-subunit amino acid transport system permease subunit
VTAVRSWRWTTLVAIAVGVGIAVALPHLFTGLTARHLLVLGAINVMLVAALDLLVGRTGLLALGHAAFWGIGAYTSALLLMRVGVSFPVGLLAAGGAGVIAGLVVGIPALRLRGHYFTVTTFITGIVITILMTNLIDLTRGPMGLTGIPFATLQIFGWQHRFLTIIQKVEYYYLVLVFVALTLLLRWWIERSRLGRAMAAIKGDENLARSVGIPTYWIKVAVFALSTGIAGVAGSLYAHYAVFISPDSFTFIQSFDLFVMNMVGGAGTTLGPIVGTAFITWIGSTLRAVSPVLAQIVYGVLLILVITFLPGGLMGAWRKLEARFFSRRGTSSLPPQPQAVWREAGVGGQHPPPTAAGGLGDGQGRRHREPRELLRVDGLTKRFGGYVAVSDFSFHVEEGEVLGLIGPNGAGKTTIFNLVSGFLPATSGKVYYQGGAVTGTAPHVLANRGLVRTFQHTRHFGDLTVWDTVLLAGYKSSGSRSPSHSMGTGRRKGQDSPVSAGMSDSATQFPLPPGAPAPLGEGRGGGQASSRGLHARVLEILDFVGLAHRARVRGRELAYGEQRTLGIAIALAAEPTLLLLDEPFAGMNDSESRRCMELVHRIRGRGVTVLVIDHNMKTMGRGCDRMVVINHGVKLAEGPPAEVVRDEAVQRAYLGAAGDALTTPRAEPQPERQEALALEQVSVKYGPLTALDQVSFRLDRGEIVALVGANGAGKTSALRAVSGLLPVAGGQVRLLGEELDGRSPVERVRKGLAHCPEGREIFPRMTVLENLELGAPAGRRDSALPEVFELFPRLRERAHQIAGSLSGGEQQMLAIGRALMSHPQVLLLDEPTLGLAPMLAREVAETLLRLNQRGVSILLAEQNAALALAIAHRGYVLENGRIALQGSASDLLGDDHVRQAYLGA